MLKLQVILVPPSAVRREQRLFQQGQSGYPNQTLNSSPNLFNRGIGTSTPNTNNNNSQNYANSSFSSQGPIQLERPSLRKFLHITSRNKSLLEVAHEISIRFEKLYPDEPSLEILKLQDSQECDLDPDYISGDVFDYDRAVRVLLNNELASEHPQSSIGDLSTITTANDSHRAKRSASPIFSSQLIPKKRRQENRESVWKGQGENNDARKKSTPLSNQIYPDEQDDVNVTSLDSNKSVRNISINADDSAETSLPPPDDNDTRYLDPRKSKPPVATSPLPPSSKRITSGMLVAPEPQLKDVEDEVLEEKQINDDITQRIIPVKKDPSEKTVDNITSNAIERESEEAEIDANADILPPPSQIKKHVPPIVEQQPAGQHPVGNHSLSTTVTLEQPKEKSKPVAAPGKADKSTIASPEKTEPTLPDALDTPLARPAKETSPDIQLSQNTSASNIIANISKRDDVTNKDSFSDSDEDQDEINEPEFTKDEIIKIFKSGRLPASVTRKFALHNSQKLVPPKTVRAAALKAAEKMSITVEGRSISPATVGKPVESEDDDEEEEADHDDLQPTEEESEESEETEESGESEKSEEEEDEEADSSDENVDYFEKKKNQAAAAAASKISEKLLAPPAAGPRTQFPEPKEPRADVSKAKAKASVETKSSPVEAPIKPIESSKTAPAKADTKKPTVDKDEDVEMADASEIPVKNTADNKKSVDTDAVNAFESLSQSLKEIDAQSTQLKDLDKPVQKVEEPIHPSVKPTSQSYVNKRVNIDELPQEYPTEEVPGLQEVLDQLRNPNTPDDLYHQLLKDRRRLLYNARRRYLRKIKNEKKLAGGEASANTTISSQTPAASQINPSQPSKIPSASQPVPKPVTTPAGKTISAESIDPSLSQDSVDFDVSKFHDDEASERTRREYENAKKELAEKRQKAHVEAMKADQAARSKRAKYYDAKEPPKSQEVVNDSSDSGSGSGSGSDSDDSDSDDDDEDEEEDDDKNKRKPRIVNTPKGLSQSTNLRKTIAANKKLPDVEEATSAPATPPSKNVENTPSKQPQSNSADSKAKQPVKKPNSRYSLSSLSDLVTRGVPDVIDSLTPKSSRTKELPQSSQKKKVQPANDSSESSEDDGDDDNSDTDDSDDSSSDEELKGSQKYLNAKTAKNLIGSQKGKVRTSSAFKGLMKDAKKK